MGKNRQSKNYNRSQEVLNNGKSKKKTHAGPKTRKEEGKGRKAEEMFFMNGKQVRVKRPETIDGVD